MRIERITIYRYTLPLRTPLPGVPGGMTHRSGCLIAIADRRGHVGWGDAAPLPGFSQESVDAVVVQAQTLAAALRGEAVPGDVVPVDDGFARWLGGFDLVPSLQFAVETAVLNLIAEAEGRTLAEVLFDEPLPEIPVCGLATGDAKQTAATVRRLAGAGYTAVKVKAGAGPVDADVDVALALAAAHPGTLDFRIDANRAWDYAAALAFAASTAPYCPIEYIEEPLANPARLAEFARSAGVPIALDETLVQAPDLAAELVADVSALVLKPTLLGGIERVLDWFAAAEQAGLAPVVSGCFESGVGHAALVALAAGTDRPDLAAGLDTYSRLAEDVLEHRLAHGPIVNTSDTWNRARLVAMGRLERIDGG